MADLADDFVGLEIDSANTVIRRALKKMRRVLAAAPNELFYSNKINETCVQMMLCQELYSSSYTVKIEHRIRGAGEQSNTDGRADVVLFLDEQPVALIELKYIRATYIRSIAAPKKLTIAKARAQLTSDVNAWGQLQAWGGKKSVVPIQQIVDDASEQARRYASNMRSSEGLDMSLYAVVIVADRIFIRKREYVAERHAPQ